MRRTLTTLATPLTILLLATPAASGPCITQLTDRCETWSATYDGPAGGGEFAETMVLAGDTVVIAGARSMGRTLTSNDTDYGVVAYRASDGAFRWAAGYGGPGNEEGSRDDFVLDLAASEDGRTVFATGGSHGTGAGPDYDYATVAFDVATGARRWVARYDRNSDWDQAEDVLVATTVDPDGTARETVFVTGNSLGVTSASRATTIAYDAATGAERWRTVTGDGRDWRTAAYTPVPRPDGSRGGLLHLSGSGLITTTLDAETGAVRWAKGMDLVDGPGYAFSNAAADGRVFSTGFVSHLDLNTGVKIDIQTLAHDATTGEILWSKTFDGPSGSDDIAERMTVANGRVFITGYSQGDTIVSSAVVLAYDAATGAQAWTDTYQGIAGESAHGWTIATSGDLVLTAAYYPFTVIANDAATGRRRWVARYTPPGAFDGAYALAPSPDGSRIYAAGGANSTAGLVTGSDMLTVAWDL